jgi:hypothetical protein
MLVLKFGGMMNQQVEHAMYLFTLPNMSFTVATANTGKWVSMYAEKTGTLVWEITRAQKCELAPHVEASVEGLSVTENEIFCVAVCRDDGLEPLPMFGDTCVKHVMQIECRLICHREPYAFLLLDENTFLMVLCSDKHVVQSRKNVSSLSMALSVIDHVYYIVNSLLDILSG